MTEMDPWKKVADRYLKREVLGEGQTVAVKKIRLGKQKEGLNFTALREIKLLKELKDPNIIGLIDAFPHKGNLYLVFEFMETDLEAVIRDRNIFISPADIKSYIQMTLKGLAFCHKKWVLHRDMKPNNLLIGANGQLKLADFGLACIFGSPDRKFTLQYYLLGLRLPSGKANFLTYNLTELSLTIRRLCPDGTELLSYFLVPSSMVLVWMFGQLPVYLLNFSYDDHFCREERERKRKEGKWGNPTLVWIPFKGTSDIDQLGKIFAALGTPTSSQWPDMVYLPDYVEYQYVPAPLLRSLFPMASDDALDLLSKMFTYDPEARITVQQALEHRYLSSAPPPTNPAKLPRPTPKSCASDFDPQDGPIVLSPPRKSRRIMPDRERLEGNSNQVEKIEKHVAEVRQSVGDFAGKSEKVPMSIDFSNFASKPLSRPTINR
ncbi:hypothetical protein REPUB_Repub08aG0099700 [Reevesia pubescens]